MNDRARCSITSLYCFAYSVDSGCAYSRGRPLSRSSNEGWEPVVWREAKKASTFGLPFRFGAGVDFAGGFTGVVLDLAVGEVGSVSSTDSWGLSGALRVSVCWESHLRWC